MSIAQAGYQLLRPGGWLFQAGWDPERFETPAVDWAIQQGFESAELHEWLYPRTQTWPEYAAVQVERGTLAAMGGRIGKGMGQPEGDGDRQPVEGESNRVTTHEHLTIAHKALR